MLAALAAPKNKFGISDFLMKSIVAECERAWEPTSPEAGGGAYSAAAARQVLSSTRAVLGELRPPHVTLHGESPPAGGTLESIGGLAASVGESAAGLLGDAAAAGIGVAGVSVTVDVLTLLPRTILAELEFEAARPEDEKKPKGGKDEDMKPWQVRMRATETVAAALAQAQQHAGGAGFLIILANDSCAALARALRKTLADPQANTRPKACAAAAALARAAGATGCLHCGALRLLAPCLLDLLGDKKAGLKDAVLAALDALVAEQRSGSGGAAGVAAPSFCALLELAMKLPALGGGGGSSFASTTSSASGTVGVAIGGRDELLGWMARHAAGAMRNGTTLPVFQALAPRAVEALGDRSPAARAAALDLAAHVVRIAGAEPVKAALKQLKPAQRLAVEAAVDAAIVTGRALSQSAAAGAAISAVDIDASGHIAVTAAGTLRPATKGMVASKKGAKAVSSSAALSAASASSVDSFALCVGASGARDARLAKSAAEAVAARFGIRLGEGSSDIAAQQRQLVRLTQLDWAAAKCAAPALTAALFAEGDTAPEHHVEAMRWLTQQLLLPETVAADAAASTPTLDFVRACSDLLLRYVACQLWEPRSKPAALSATFALLDRVLSLFTQRGWGLAWLEGEVLLPALCERAGAGGVGSNAVDDKASGLLVNAVLALRSCAEYVPRNGGGADGALVQVLERHIYSRVLDPKSRQSTRVALCGVVARVMRAVSAAGKASFGVCLRRSCTVQLVRLCERDGMAPREAPVQNVDMRAAIGEVLAELLVQLGHTGAADAAPSVSAFAQMWRLATIDAKAAAAMGLPVGVTLEVGSSLRTDIEKKWAPAWLIKRARDIEAEARFLQPGRKAEPRRPSDGPAVVLQAQPPGDEEIAAALRAPATLCAPSPQQSIRRSSIEQALAAVADEAAAAAASAAASVGERAVATLQATAPIAPAGVAWRSAAVINATVAAEEALLSPTRPLMRSGIGNSRIPGPDRASQQQQPAQAPAPVVPSFCSVGILSSAGPLAPFSTIPPGLLPSCPVEVCSGLTNLRSACKRAADTLATQPHSSGAAFSASLTAAMGDAAGSLEALDAFLRRTCRAASLAAAPSPEAARAQALKANALALAESLALAWRVLPCAPTVLGAGISSPRARGTHVAAAERAMVALPAATALLLSQCPGFAWAVPPAAAHALLAAIEFAHARQAHAHSRAVHEAIGRALMACVFHLRRPVVASWFLAAFRATAAWRPPQPHDPAPLPANSRRTRNLRSLMRRLPAYEFRIETLTSEGAGAVGTSARWGGDAAAELLLLARAFADFFDDPAICARAEAVVFASPVASSGQAQAPADLSPLVMGCEADADVCASVVGAIAGARDLFLGLVGQLGLALAPTLTNAGLPAASAHASLTRRLFHAALASMALQQGVQTLSAVCPWAFDARGAETAFARAIAASTAAPVTAPVLDLATTGGSLAFAVPLSARTQPAVPATPGQGAPRSAATSLAALMPSSPTSALTHELVGAVAAAMASSAVASFPASCAPPPLPFDEAAEKAAAAQAFECEARPAAAVPRAAAAAPPPPQSAATSAMGSSMLSVRRGAAAGVVAALSFSSPLPAGMSYDAMVLAAPTPMPPTRLDRGDLGGQGDSGDTAFAPPPAAPLAAAGPRGPVDTPSALHKREAAVIMVPAGLGAGVARRLLEGTGGEGERVPAVVPTLAAAGLSSSSTTPLMQLPVVDDCRAAAATLAPLLRDELEAALAPCLAAAAAAAAPGGAGVSAPPPWKAHAVPIIASCVARASASGLLGPCVASGRDVPLSDSAAAFVYVRMSDAGVSATSAKVLWSNLNLYALKQGPAAGDSSVPLSKLGVFALARYITTQASTVPARAVLGATVSSTNVGTAVSSKAPHAGSAAQ